MDALLRYLLYNIIFTVLVIQLSVMVFCVLAIIIVKLFSSWREKRKEGLETELTGILQNAFLNPHPANSLRLPAHLNNFEGLIETLEKFDERYDDPKWTEIKNQIIDQYLLPKVESYASSYSWYKRQLAARCYLLRPQKSPQKTVKRLLEDKNYLVRIPAIFCVTKMNDRNLFNELIQQMSQESKLSQFMYRDALIQADQEKFEWLESILANAKDPNVIDICLDVLSTRFSKNLIQLAPPHLTSRHRSSRVKAIEALGSLPDEKAINYLVNHLDDSDAKIREAAAAGLDRQHVLKAIPQISELLNDPAWEVRLQAAKTLKNFGREGMSVLDAQKKEVHPKAYEIAQYVLSMPGD